MKLLTPMAYSYYNCITGVTGPTCDRNHAHIGDITETRVKHITNGLKNHTMHQMGG